MLKLLKLVNYLSWKIFNCSVNIWICSFFRFSLSISVNIGLVIVIVIACGLYERGKNFEFWLNISLRKTLNGLGHPWRVFLLNEIVDQPFVTS